ncbi:hypothetical protein [Companilactobacillus sp.]|jgi:VIT1/CCC1 family predicted Fe2+/Mn2+ transporter|uniref:hypothetical protein n=1 Tax=Companilactobacillus sp. TaxID=2767905 RepID=UPI0025C2F161|nr:hypothetical protein [Companilactobacillus sp.]MCH4008905.1 hypothetical protein [Companilactobacillus sp.]MCH4050916.1 hypothetical protein [Companilactobacillus sp.]MCH4076848.1 hypothetical protein [Companilactobacillus sp.]MCH4125423.1 hypothetical protein [Companilactobacillus sp.]MCH4131965.1 hypothetical protein [Companilactobacillus sp.]
MKNKEPVPDQDSSETLAKNHHCAKKISIIVCILSVIFLLAWFLLIKKQYDSMILLYCLAPLVLFFILNWAFDYSYKKGKD